MGGVDDEPIGQDNELIPGNRHKHRLQHLKEMHPVGCFPSFLLPQYFLLANMFYKDFTPYFYLLVIVLYIFNNYFSRESRFLRPSHWHVDDKNKPR